MKNRDLMNNNIDSIDILNIIKKGKFIIVVSVLVTLASVLFATLVLMTPVYEAKTKVLVKEEKLDPKDDFPSYDSGWQFAHAQQVIIKSKYVLARALGKIDFSDKMLSEIDPNSLGIDDLKSRINLRLLDNTNICDISVEHENAMFTAMLANAVVETYIEDRVKLKTKTIDRIIASLEKEIKISKNNFTAIENELDEISSQDNMIMLSGSDIILDLQKFASSEMQLTSANADIEMVDIKIKEIKSRLEKVDSKDAGMKFIVNSSILQNLKSQIRIAETKLDMLKGEFNVNHPEVKVAQASIDKFKKDLFNERKNILKAEMESLEITKKSLIGKRDVLLETHNNQSERLNKVLLNQPKLSRLNRDITMNRKIFSDLNEKLHSLKILKLRTTMIPDIEIIEVAEVPTTPIKPDLVKNLLLGLLVGLTIGFGMAIASSVSVVQSSEESGHYSDQFTERRASERTKTSNKITCSVVGEDKEYDCWGKDIGRSGMKIITPKKLQRNNILEFEIHRDKMKPIVGNGVVVWSSPVAVNGSNNEYAAGVKFYDLELDIKNTKEL